MSRLTRDGMARPASRDQILRSERTWTGKYLILCVQLTTCRIGNLTRLIHTLLCVMTIYTHTLGSSIKRHEKDFGPCSQWSHLLLIDVFTCFPLTGLRFRCVSYFRFFFNVLLERVLSALMLRALAVGRRRQFESLGVVTLLVKCRITFFRMTLR